MTTDARDRYQGRRRWRAIALVAVPVVFTVLGRVVSAELPEAPNAAYNDDCLRCHGMATLGYQEPSTGAVVSLHVDATAYRLSNHADLSCVDCHVDTYATYPHPGEDGDKALNCVDCHAEPNHADVIQLDEYGEAVDRSVHADLQGDPFTCFDCHDPHTFDTVGESASVADVLQGSNAVCLACHVRVAGLGASAPARQDASHAWLPNTDLHMRHVRCVDCHAADAEAAAHELLAVEDARTLCVDCHTAGSALLTTLYRDQFAETGAHVGFINGAALSDAYVIGMTRNVALERASFIALALLLVATTAHAVGRRRAAGKAGA